MTNRRAVVPSAVYITFTYKVVMIPTDEGVSVSCPALPGCWSQGAIENEALANISEAIREYLDVKLTKGHQGG